MYPDIEKHKVSVGLTFSEEKNAYILKFKRGKQELVTQIDKSDADDCMNNIRCLHLGIKWTSSWGTSRHGRSSGEKWLDGYGGRSRQFSTAGTATSTV